LVQARRQEAEHALADLMATLPAALRPELVVTHGRPAEEIVRIAHERKADALILGLHSNPGGGPRMGSVAYQVLCHCSALIVALPPAVDRMTSRRFATAASAV